MTAPVVLAMLLDDSALLSFEYQLHLADVVGLESWSVDLETASFEFTGPTPRTCTAVHLLGTAAPGPQSWLWAWANPTAFPAEVIAVAHQVRAFGEHYGIEVLRAAEVPFAALPQDKQDPLGATVVFGDAAKVISGRWTLFNADVGSGTRVALLLEHTDFVLGPPDPARVLRVMQQGLAEFPITDYRRAVHSYCVQRQLTISWQPDGNSATITGPRLRITVEYDWLGRVHMISGKLGEGSTQ